MLRSERVMLFINPMFVELDDRLGQIEIDGAAAFALAIQNQRQIAHQFETVAPAARSARAQPRSPSSTAFTSV